MTPVFPLLQVAQEPSRTPRRFEDLADSLARFPELLKSIPDTIREPAANPTQAVLLLAILLVAILIVVVSAVLVALKASSASSARQPASEATGPAAATGEQQPADKKKTVRSRVFVGAVIVLVVAALWAALGISTATRTTCLSCHPDTAHASAPVEDPHRTVACVSCHESGGPLSSTLVNPAIRLEHVVRGQQGKADATSYGRQISSDSCRRCHGAQLAVTSVDKVRGIRISHREPLAAGAECVDCHTLTSGAISLAGPGMSTCLRCHDGKKASAKCSVCHIGDPAQVERARETTQVVVASELVKNPQCDGCHTSQKTCDACHGIRMPHSDAFMQWGHAREAALDIWDNGGRTCRKCHYEGHRPCTQCHFSFPAHPASFRESHQAAHWGGACSCHEWDPQARGMLFCEICHSARPESATR